MRLYRSSFGECVLHGFCEIVRNIEAAYVERRVVSVVEFYPVGVYAVLIVADGGVGSHKFVDIKALDRVCRVLVLLIRGNALVGIRISR